MAKVITFINMKGGVGKTTLAVNVAYTLSKVEGKKVILIDMDPQMNATQYTLTEPQMNEILDDIGWIVEEAFDLNRHCFLDHAAAIGGHHDDVRFADV